MKKILKNKTHKRIKILFINPPQSANPKDKFTNHKLPLGFLYMAGVLEKNGFEVKILDCPLYYKFKRKINKDTIRIGLLPKQIKQEIQEFNPDIIGVSCSFTMYEADAFEVIDLIKTNFKDKLIVVGGAHSSANPKFVLRNKKIDLVVIGEGENTILEIAQKYNKNQKLTNIKGTALRTGNKIKINKPREYIQDLDSLKPAWHLIDMQSYFNHPDNSIATMRKNSVDIVSSRGCPGNCVFCSIHTVWGRKWRARTPKNVVDEIEFLCKKYGAKQFRFQDDNLTLNKKRILKICDEIIKRKLDIKWDTPNGVALWALDKEILSKMKKAGCYRVTFGVESGCKNTQKYIGKVINLDYINEMVNFCHKIGLWVCSTFIMGFPNETKEEIEQTRKFILSSKINFPFIYIAQPYQGTRMYEDFKQKGLIKDFAKLSNIKNTRYNTLYLKSKELNNILADTYKQFYFQKIKSYLNPFIFYSEFFSKIRSFEDLKYTLRMIKAVIFK